MSFYQVNIPSPSKKQISFYLSRREGFQNYKLQENALNKLFLQLCPKNEMIEDILLKVSTLNDFYSTNIFSVFPGQLQFLIQGRQGQSGIHLHIRMVFL